MSDSQKPDGADEKFTHFVARKAEGYNEPAGEVPREEMWSAITMARAGASRVARSPHSSRLSLLVLAATLVLGVLVGRFALSRSGTGAEQQPIAAGTPMPTDTTNASYRVAAASHLMRAEALLTTYESAESNAAFDAQLATWARDLLNDTRLLMDSPAARDPLRHRLLEDLEVVLVQLVQRAPADGAKDERSHINRTLARTHMLNRLRTAQPAGSGAGL